MTDFSIDIPEGFSVEFDTGQRTGIYSNQERYYRLVGDWVRVELVPTTSDYRPTDG